MLRDEWSSCVQRHVTEENFLGLQAIKGNVYYRHDATFTLCSEKLEMHSII